MKTNIFYIKKDIIFGNEKNAGSKAVNDIEDILKEMGATEVCVSQTECRHGLRVHLENAKYFRQSTEKKCNKEGDCLIIQMPILSHSIFLGREIRGLRNKKVKVIVLVHDLDYIRYKFILKDHGLSYIRKIIEDGYMMKSADVVIVHNENMKKSVMHCGISEDKIITLNIFDYLIDASISNCCQFTKSEKLNRIVIAGNLSPEKGGYIYKLPSSPEFLLYGANYDETMNTQNNVTYMGSYLPDELAVEINGDFGLVWDGDSTETCTGPYGEYLRYNNPHKTSLYLACGIPVIIWKEAALAHFILDNNIGYVVESLSDISDLIGHITIDEYLQVKKNVEKISAKVRNGYYFKNALKKCRKKLIME